MSKGKMKAFNTQNYSAYIETLKSIIQQNAVDAQRVEQLQCFTKCEESKLQNSLQNLCHLKDVQQQEYNMWQARSQELSNTQKKLELLIEQQSKNLAFSKAKLEHGLRMIDLMPSSRPSDYLANTGLHKSPSENIRDDWEKVGEQLSQSFFKNIETHK